MSDCEKVVTRDVDNAVDDVSLENVVEKDTTPSNTPIPETSQQDTARPDAISWVTEDTNNEVVMKRVAKVPRHGTSRSRQHQRETRTVRVRENKNLVIEQVIEAFRQHPLHRFNELVKITKQPSRYLRKILMLICKYNHNMHTWELLPTYKRFNNMERSVAVTDFASDNFN